MTDHPQLMDLALPNGDRNGDYGAGEWALETVECASAQSKYGISVINGEEISTWVNPNTGHDSHYLGYNLNNFFVNFYNENNNPLNDAAEVRTGQEIIDDVNAVGGVGVIAHPYWTSCLWDYWDTTGYVGMELTSGMDGLSPRKVDTTTLGKWISLLNAKKHIVGLANSDSHFLGDAYGKIMTYLYIPGGHYTDHNTVYEAMRKRRAVISERGSLAAFTVTTPSDPTAYNIGDTLYLNASNPESITLNVQSIGADGRKLSKIRLCSNYAAPASFPASKTTINIGKDYPIPLVGEESYFRIEADFRLSNTQVEIVYTNPIWVKTTKTVIDFEDLVEGQFVGTHYPGLIFSSEWRCGDTATGKYNDSAYPPHSPTKALWTGLTHNAGTIWFDTPVRFVEGWFSALHGVFIDAYDTNGNLLKWGYTQAYGSSAPIQISVPLSSNPIKYVVVHDSADYWIMDDFAYSE